MTENSDPKENAMAERVNGILKVELLLGEVHRNFKAAYRATRRAIHIYNYKRLHASCDYLTPATAHQRTGRLQKHWKNYRKEWAIQKRKEKRETDAQPDPPEC